MSRSCRRCCLVTVGQGCQEEAQKKKAEEEGELDEDSEERKFTNEIAQEVVAGIKEKASAHDDAKAIAQKQLGKGSS